MKSIYYTKDSIEAEAIVKKMSEQGIEASCNRKDEFNAVTGVAAPVFDVMVEESQAAQAASLLKDYKKDLTAGMSGSYKKRKNAARITAVICLLIFLVGFVASIVSSLM